MRDIFAYEKRHKYPHMKPADVAIWERFIEKYPDLYTSVQYDFNVGDPPPFNTLNHDGEDLNQDMLYRLKIDVVGQKKGEIDIIEIKPNASASTIGQVQGYKALYIRDEEPKDIVRMVIITDKKNTNFEYLCQQAGVIFYEV